MERGAAQNGNFSFIFKWKSILDLKTNGERESKESSRVGVAQPFLYATDDNYYKYIYRQ